MSGQLNYPKLTPEQRRRAEELEAQCANDPEAAAYEIIFLRDLVAAGVKNNGNV
jgi:hypothetical protein